MYTSEESYDLPASWQLHPPKPSLQWHTPFRQAPFIHCAPSSLVQSSKIINCIYMVSCNGNE